MTRWADELGTNDELRRRQGDGEVGFLQAGSTFPVFLRVMWLPIALMVVGLFLAYVGPLPGLGVFMMAGGGMGAGVLAMNVWLGR